MARVSIILSDELEKEFREKTFKKYGMKKGNITVALTEAIEEWTHNEK